jgi:orotate phosphoribosyltransferase-like protein
MALTVAGTTSNNGTYIINTVGATVLTLIAAESLVAEGPLSATATLNGEVGFVRTLNQVDYPFNWRLFGNGCNLNQAFEYIQRQLRRATDIDLATGIARGDVTDLLMSYASPTGTGFNLYIDDLDSTDLNNATFADLTGDSRNFAFIAGVTITINDNIINSGATKVVVFFTNNDAGDNDGSDFGTVNAIIVNDADNNPMTAINPSGTLTFTYDYDNNAQRGAGSTQTSVPITIVAIGTDTAQYVQSTGSIIRANNNTFALVAALERNYANP